MDQKDARAGIILPKAPLALMRKLGLGRRSEPLDEDALISEDAPPDVRAELSAIYALIDALPPRERLCLVLRRVEGLSSEEVAETLSVSLSTAKRLASASDEALSLAMSQGKK